MRLIDADALDDVIQNLNEKNWGITRNDYKMIDAVLFEFPTADRPQGEWIFNPKDAIEMMFTLPKCSECGHESSDALNYCPNCGARMKGADDE